MNNENTWDAHPIDDIADHEFDAWIDAYRHRVLTTEFSGRSARRDQSVLLALAVLMARQRERIVECTYAELVYCDS